MPTQKTSDWRERLKKEFVVLTIPDMEDLIENGNESSPFAYEEDIVDFIESLLEEQREEIRGERIIVELFSGKKLIKSEYIPSDEVWVGTGKTRNEIMKQNLALSCLQIKEK